MKIHQITFPLCECAEIQRKHKIKKARKGSKNEIKADEFKTLMNKDLYVD